MSKTALVTGAFGMDAKNLISILLEEGYEVHSTYRYSSVPLEERLKGYPHPNITLHSMDLTDYSGVTHVVAQGQYDLIFNLAAQSHVGESFKNPYYAIQVDGVGPLNILEAVRLHSPHSRTYMAMTSENFGNNREEVSPGIFQQSINTPLSPNSPYGIGKTMAAHLARIYRDGYGLYVVNGILFNHTDITRTPTFFERKVSKYVAGLATFMQKSGATFKSLIHTKTEICQGSYTYPKLALGTIEGVYRDIGWSHDYMRAALMMVSQDSPKDYVVATGEAHPLTSILEIMFAEIGCDDFSQFIYIDPAFVRPVDVPYLCGDSSPIREELGWQPTKSFEELMGMLVNNDLGIKKPTTFFHPYYVDWKVEGNKFYNAS